ncbi:MFS transporter [Pseudomonas atacamensis]|uniref:MFS transporter n=1 Tax=Pseudomonas atacamensis TaxID=2565368 RepID=UPI0024478E62|nr:MFS transporter [Pseudomonas atacamensis]MDH2076830.1 MFS transporter [Pseudomonas atacamensis]
MATDDAASRQAPPLPVMPARQRWLVLTAVMLAFTPVVIDMTILHVAIPSLTLALSATSIEMLWIIDIYPLLMAGLLVPMGTLADRLGNRRVLLIGLTVFGIASLCAALAPSAALLIVARGLLALGGSMIMPSALGIIRRTFEDPQERATALGIWGTVGAAGAAVGPLVGGALLEHYWWGSVFLINVPLMILIIPVVRHLLSRRETLVSGNWNIGQAALLIGGMVSVVYSIKAVLGSTVGLYQAVAVGAAGLLLLGVFTRLQNRARLPMLDLGLFHEPAICAGMLMALVVTGALAGVELTLAIEMQYVLERTPLQAGIFMLPIMVAAAVGGPVAGMLSNRFGLCTVSSLSLAVSAGALAYLAYQGLDASLLTAMVMASLGLALSIGLTASSIAILGAVDASKGAAAGSLEATAYELGTALGITLFGAFMSSVFNRYLQAPSQLHGELLEKASRSIGDSMVVAKQLSPVDATALVEAAKVAFLQTHSVLLGVCASLLGLLAMMVFAMLRRMNRP